jgi:RHS repeat-associated protein
MAATTGTAEQILSLPGGGGDVRGLGETFRPDLHSGTGSYAIPLDIPNGPNDIAPKLTLLYQTGSGNGPFGMGFGLHLPAIARSTDRRIPTYRDTDDVLVLLGGGELVSTGGADLRLRIDDGSWRIRREGGGFRLTDRDGRFYRLGVSEQARLFTDAGGATKVLQWQLEDIEDALGNRCSFGYRRDRSQLYLEQIKYGPYSVVFDYQPRPDPITNCRGGFPVTTRLRCRTIELHLENSPAPLVRRWQLEYRSAEPAGHSLLSRITLTGFDEQGRSASLPALSLGYTTPRPRRLERIRSEVVGTAPGVFAGGRRELLDWDGDGLPDLIELAGGVGRIWRNVGDLTWARPERLPALPVSVALDEPAVAFADMDGTGTADLVMLDRQLPGYYPHQAGGGFDRPVFWRQSPSARLGDPSTRLVDLNGDGLVDLLHTGPSAFTLFLRDPENGWRPPRTVPRSQAPPVSLEDPRVGLADMNGDGFQDLVRVDGAGVTYWPYLGDGRWDDATTFANPPVLPRRYDPRRMFLVDIDGDGCADLVYVDASEVSYWLNLGGVRFGSPQVIANTPSCVPAEVRLVDMTGTGTPGVLWSSDSPSRRTVHHFFLDLAGASKPYLLNRIENGMGLATRIEYGFSTEQAVRDRRAGRPWHTFLPFPLPVVTRLRSTDAVTGRESSTAFSYHSGHFDSRLREFCGFGNVDVEEAGDDSAPSLLTRNWFHTGNQPDTAGAVNENARTRLRALRGKLLRTEVLGLDGSAVEDRPYQRTENDWEVEVTGPGTVAPRLRESRTSYFERALTPYRIATTHNHAHDAAGNVTDEEQRAEDPRDPSLTRVLRTTITVADDPTGRFVAKPARVTQVDGAGDVLATTISYYDGLPEREVGAAGLVTRVEARVLTDHAVTQTYGTTVPDFTGLGYHRRSGEDGWWIDKASYTRTDNGAGLRGTTTNARGQVTQIAFDAAKLHPARVVDALGNETTARFDQRANKLASLTDANGATIANRYDPLGRLESVVDPGADEALPTTRYLVDTGAVPAVVATERRVVDGQPGVMTQRTFFDGSGAVLERRIATRTGEIVERCQQYSSRGLIREQLLPHTAASTAYSLPAPDVPRRRLRYDALGRLVEVENPDGSVQRQVLEPGVAVLFDEEDARAGPAASHANTPTRHVFDPTGRIREVVLDHGGTPIRTRYQYDAKGNLLEVSDAAGVRAAFGYDLLGRRLRTDAPGMGTSVFVFDANGNQVERRDARGAVTQFSYDELDRLLRVAEPSTGETMAAYTYHDTTPAPPPEAGPFTRGRQVKATSPGGETVYEYDAAGRITRRRVRPTGLPGVELVLDFSYRADGQCASVTYPRHQANAGRRVVPYQYDERGLLEHIPNFVRSIEHNAAGQRERVEFANGVITRYSYDPATMRLSNLRTVDAGGGVLQDLAYSHDLVGNLVRVASPEAEHDATYGYDDLYRLTSSSTAAGETASYSYDERDNLLVKSDVGAYGYDSAGRLTSAGPDTLSYTAAGQPETGPWGNTSYDALGRITSIIRGADREDFLYDHDGRRTRAVRTGPAGAQDVLTPDDLVAVVNGVFYIYVLDGSARVAQLRLDNGAIGFLHGDHLGSTSVVTGPAGQVLRRIRYDPFGGVLENTGAGDDPLHRFTGQLWDDWSQLLQLNTRMYSPRLGRMLTPDSIAPELYQPQSWNQYSYVQNNPMRYADPTGHLWEEVGDWFEDNWVSVVAVVVIALVVVITIATFGAGALIGVGIMMAIGGLVGGLAAGAAGGDILEGVLVGMAVGGAAGLAGMGIGTGMSAVFGAKTLAATVLTGTLAGAVSGGAMGFAAGYAGGQGTSGEIWDKVWKGALTGAVSGALFGLGSYAMGSGALGTGRLDYGWRGVQRLGVGFLTGSAVEIGRSYAFEGEPDWGSVLVAGGIGAAIGGFSRFGGDSGLPVLSVLKPEHVGIASSIFAQATSFVVVLDYADDLWQFLRDNNVSQATGGEMT